MMNKYELIDSLIVQTDALEDARGVTKCRMILEMVDKLSALKTGLKSEEDAVNARIEIAESEMRRLSTPSEAKDGEETVGGQVYKIQLGGDE